MSSKYIYVLLNITNVGSGFQTCGYYTNEKKALKTLDKLMETQDPEIDSWRIVRVPKA